MQYLFNGVMYMVGALACKKRKKKENLSSTSSGMYACHIADQPHASDITNFCPLYVMRFGQEISFVLSEIHCNGVHYVEGLLYLLLINGPLNWFLVTVALIKPQSY